MVIELKYISVMLVSSSLKQSYVSKLSIEWILELRADNKYLIWKKQELLIIQVSLVQ